MMIRLNKLLVVFACCCWVISAQSQSYISGLWNTKKYEAITEYSAKGATLSGQDNAFVGRAFMALDPPQPMRALSHYDLAIAKRWHDPSTKDPRLIPKEVDLSLIHGQ